MRVEAVVAEQSGEVDDVVHVLVVVRFVRDEDPPWMGAKSLTDAGSVRGKRRDRELTLLQGQAVVLLSSVGAEKSRSD